MTQHTEGLLALVPTAADHGETTTITSSDGFGVASISSAAWDDSAVLEFPQDRPNGQRLVAAWNASVGIPTIALEQGIVQELAALARCFLDLIESEGSLEAQGLPLSDEDNGYHDDWVRVRKALALIDGKKPEVVPEKVREFEAAADSSRTVDANTTVRIPLVVGVYSHKHGDDIDVHENNEDATAAFASIALQFWGDRADTKAPADPRASGWTDQQIVDAYFDGNEREFMNLEDRTLLVPVERLQELIRSPK